MFTYKKTELARIIFILLDGNQPSSILSCLKCSMFPLVTHSQAMPLVYPSHNPWLVVETINFLAGQSQLTLCRCLELEELIFHFQKAHK